MRPDARYGTAIELLDQILAGAPAEQVLTNWARANRYAGSKDRAAVRDIVFSGLRGRSSYQACGGGQGGRALVMGLILSDGIDPDTVFTGQTYAPAVLSAAERVVVADFPSEGEPVYDVPDWLIDPLHRALGADFPAVMAALRDRATVDLRVNLAKATPDQAIASLAKDGIVAVPAPLCQYGLRVQTGERGVARSKAYLNGLVELQDAGSQKVVELLPLPEVESVLDYCAGGGGKSLAMASLAGGALNITAYDASANRLKNLENRAERAGASMNVAESDPVQGSEKFDLVLLDVPCSGSGAWRRNPDGKWKFQPADLTALTEVQESILDSTKSLVRDGGWLAYVTCSLLREENEDQIDRFLARHKGWRLVQQRRLPLGRDSDGFFLALIAKE